VLWLGALGDRYGRKVMPILGVLLSIPACILAATAPTIGVLIAARMVGGFSAGMAYPTTLALITALWSGPGRTRSIALWSALGGALSALGPLVSGYLLQSYYWGLGLPDHHAGGRGTGSVAHIPVPRIPVRQDVSRDLAALLLDDFRDAVAHFDEHPVTVSMTKEESSGFSHL
jgi:MFS family permease